MQPATLNFDEASNRAWLRGDTEGAIPFQLLQDDGEPVSLADAYVQMYIYDRVDGVELARIRSALAPAAPVGLPTSTITITDAAQGTGQVDPIPPSITNALCPSKAPRRVRRWYTLEFTLPGPVVMTLARGWIEVLPDGT